jgi:ATP-dependent Zn protease
LCLIGDCYNIAVEILETNRHYLDYIANYLISNQTITSQNLELKTIKY